MTQTIEEAPAVYEVSAISEARGLSERQDKFVDMVVSGLNPTEAARVAQYNHPKQDAWRLLQLPKIQREIRDRSTALLDTKGAVVGVNTLIKIAENEKAPAAARVQAANSLLDRAGIGKKDSKSQGLGDKSISEMGLAELDAFIRAGSEALARERAKKDATDATIIDATAQTNPPDGEES